MAAASITATRPACTHSRELITRVESMKQIHAPVNWVPEHLGFSLSVAEILVLAGTAGAGGMAPQTITRVSARLKHVQ